MKEQATLDFAACDTTWRVHARGRGAATAAADARDVVRALESRLNAFDERSAVARLHREGRVADEHVAALVRRADEYRARTGGVFDVRRGALEHAVKDHIRSGAPMPGAGLPLACYRVDGETVETDAPLDLNGIAKGYIVDRARAALDDAGVEGFVDGGGDIATPTGPVAVESPYDPDALLGVLDTRWNVATSGPSRRRRGAVDHIYDARDGRVGSRHDQVTVLARRDCVEADVLATTLAAMPLVEGLALVSGWPGVEAMWVDQGSIVASGGFADHVAQDA
jgi:thiamine biosynthesis lipoprotein